jgi:SAM-dependent methyltransferase
MKQTKNIAKTQDRIFKEVIEKGDLEPSNFESNTEFFESLKIGKGQRILEIGSTTGYFLNNVYSLGYRNLHGCDITKVALNFAKKKNKNITYRLITNNKLPFKADYFDVVLSFDTIEHIPDIKLHFKEAKRILKKGGFYAFSTPHKYVDIAYNIHKINKLFKGHCSLQTRYSLRKIAKELGFSSISFRRIRYHVTKSLKERVPKGMEFTVPVIKRITENRLFQPSIYCIMKR